MSILYHFHGEDKADLNNLRRWFWFGNEWHKWECIISTPAVTETLKGDPVQQNDALRRQGDVDAL